MVKKRTKGQVWIETVIYTLITFFMIGVVLSFVKPKIEESQDKIVIDKSIELLDNIHNEILSVAHGGQGNKRIIKSDIKRGGLEINGTGDKIIFDLEGSKYAYSEVGHQISIGKINASTKREGGLYNIQLVLDYSSEYDIQYSNSEQLFQISRGATPYSISIENKGGNPPVINLEVG